MRQKPRLCSGRVRNCAQRATVRMMTGPRRVRNCAQLLAMREACAQLPAMRAGPLRWRRRTPQPGPGGAAAAAARGLRPFQTGGCLLQSDTADFALGFGGCVFDQPVRLLLAQFDRRLTSV